ncbi:MAG: zf-HC2 domain-containing protein [Candidatus Eisenbacteria bacterium]
MTHCPETLKVQDWLDGELAPEEAARFAAHMAGCPECETEAAVFKVVFHELRHVPELEPPPALFGRIMDQVLPHRVPRWVRVLGYAYAGAFAASLVAIGSAFFLPGPSTWLHGIIAAGMRSLTGTGTFVLRSLSDGVAHMGDSFAGGGSVARMSKVAFGILSQPAVLMVLGAALVVCAAVLWWMRPRERRTSGELPHVGLLGL